MSMNLSRQAANAAPIYLRVADELETKILKQPAGSELPSEHELARRYKISRLTARASLEELERRYLVRRAQGKRTMVARRIDYIIGPESTPSWSRSMELAGAKARSQTERLQLRAPSAAIRAKLGLSAAASTFFLSRTRFIDDELVGIADTWLAADLVPMLAERMPSDASLHHTLDTIYHLLPQREWARAESVFAPPRIAARLGLEGRPLVLRLTGVTSSRKLKRPIEFTTSWLRVDVFNIVFEMGCSR
jgi:GntR family transcriptional regulator